MKKLILTTALSVAMCIAMAQKYAYVDTDYILSKVPEYSEAQEELDKLAEEWQEEIDALFTEVEELKAAYEADEFLLPDDMKQTRLTEIDTKFKAAMNLQKRYFGVEGELFTKRQELIKPIQDQIYNAIAEIAERGRYAFVFDKATNSNILYADPQYDKSDDVLEQMGY